MKVKLDTMPAVMEGPGAVMRRQSAFGDMDVVYLGLPRGTDFGPLLKGLKDDCCQCPHWGYLIEGVFRITYQDGSEDLLEKGDVFFLPPNHTALVEEDVKCVMFSPDKLHGEVLDHAMSNLARMSEA